MSYLFSFSRKLSLGRVNSMGKFEPDIDLELLKQGNFETVYGYFTINILNAGKKLIKKHYVISILS